MVVVVEVSERHSRGEKQPEQILNNNNQRPRLTLGVVLWKPRDYCGLRKMELPTISNAVKGSNKK